MKDEGEHQESAPQSTGQIHTERRPRRRSKLRRATTWLSLLVLAGVGLRLLFEVSLWRTQVALENRWHTAADRWMVTAHVLGFLAPSDVSQAELHLLLARTHRRMKRFDRVSPHLQQALDAECDLQLVEREQWLALAQTGQFEQVGPHLAELFQDAGSDGPEICSAYVALLLSRFRTALAMQILHVWEADYPDDSEAPFQRGRVEFVLQNWPKAIEGLSQSLELDSLRLDARLMRAQARIKLVQFEEAMNDLKFVLAQRPDDLTARVAQATCLSNLSSVEQAREVLTGVLADDGENAAALSQLGRLELQLGNQAAALPHLEQAARIRPEDTDTRYALARTLQAMGRKQDAAPHFQFVTDATRELLKLGPLVEQLVAEPDNVDLRYRVAMITWKWKSRDDGEKWLRSVLEYDPHHAATHTALIHLYEAANDPGRAEAHRKALSRRQQPE